MFERARSSLFFCIGKGGGSEIESKRTRRSGLPVFVSVNTDITSSQSERGQWGAAGH